MLISIGHNSEPGILKNTLNYMLTDPPEQTIALKILNCRSPALRIVEINAGLFKIVRGKI
jgi:hypothetical protein